MYTLKHPARKFKPSSRGEGGGGRESRHHHRWRQHQSDFSGLSAARCAVWCGCLIELPGRVFAACPMDVLKMLSGR
eukprot:8449200-Pyramimonas_sp.AAC.1